MHTIKKAALFLFVCLALLLTIAALLNPFDGRMFTFHDDTQAARIHQMALNLKQGQFPPRLAPELSHDLGFPVFNFYAPFAYWITTGIHLTGMPIVMALKFSFLLSLIVAFAGMFFLLKAFFRFGPSIAGAVAYVSSLWFAIEIFVRGNLAECWFLALFPLALYLLVKNSRQASRYILLITSLVLSFVLTTHNVMSLLSLGLFGVFIFFLQNKKRNILALAFGLSLASYFLIPALLESPLTLAAQVAQATKYNDHFLCLRQLWGSSKWEYGGSAAGCENDGMPFILGKFHIMMGAAGAMLYLYRMVTQKKKNALSYVPLFFLLLGLSSMFLAIYQSAFLWSLLSPVLALFQFPWRFLVFVALTLAFFTAYLFQAVVVKFPRLIAFGLVLVGALFLLFTSKKFFSKPWLMTYDEYAKTYLTKNYISNTVAYNMAEYLPKTADYSYWRSFDPQLYPEKIKEIPITEGSPLETKDRTAYKILSNSPFSKEVSVSKQTDITLNIHYFPFWDIYVNNKKIIPNKFDKLGRPVLYLSQPAIVHVFYHETIIEKISNTITLTALLLLSFLVFYKPLWNRLKTYLK